MMVGTLVDMISGDRPSPLTPALVPEMTHGQTVSRLYYGNFPQPKRLRRCSRVIQSLVTNG